MTLVSGHRRAQEACVQPLFFLYICVLPYMWAVMPGHSPPANLFPQGPMCWAPLAAAVHGLVFCQCIVSQLARQKLTGSLQLLGKVQQLAPLCCIKYTAGLQGILMNAFATEHQDARSGGCGGQMDTGTKAHSPPSEHADLHLPK
eukprot:1158095-Pelagomonas_calceolata.AAC.6